MDLRLVVVALAAACSGGKPKVDDARPGVHPAEHAADHPSDAGRSVDAAAVPIPPGKGDVSIRVEWKDVPIDARAGKPCGPDVAPTTTWGIPDTVVTLVGPATPPPAHPGRVVLERCLSPRVQVAGDTLAIASGKLQPAALTLDKLAIALPIAGHEVDAPLTAGRHELVAGDARAWVVSEPWAAVTDGSGVAVLRDVPSGVYPVTAWQPATHRAAKGEVTVHPGALAEVTLQLQEAP